LTFIVARSLGPRTADIKLLADFQVGVPGHVFDSPR
jgi:hypothetical protein